MGMCLSKCTIHTSSICLFKFIFQKPGYLSWKSTQVFCTTAAAGKGIIMVAKIFYSPMSIFIYLNMISSGTVQDKTHCASVATGGGEIMEKKFTPKDLSKDKNSVSTSSQVTEPPPVEDNKQQSISTEAKRGMIRF